jgi:hypothetical protein
MGTNLHTYLTKNHKTILWLAFPILSLALHAHLFNLPLQGIHAWRQCETASNVIHFAETDPNILNPHVYSLEWEDGGKRMEFPIMQWLFAQCFKIFGPHDSILRILSWIIGFLTVIGFFKTLDLLFKDKFIALAGAWCWMFSPVIFYYSINPLPDNLALCAAVWGTACCLHAYRNNTQWPILLAWACFSLATAAKLPFIVFLSIPYGILLNQAYRFFKEARPATLPFLQQMIYAVTWLGLAMLGVLIMLPALLWYAWVIPQWTGNGVVTGILDTTGEDIPKLLKIFLSHLISTLPELLLNYATFPIFLVGTWQVIKRRLYRHPLALPFGTLALGCIAYFIFEINMISNIHDYYLFPVLPGLFILVAIGIRAAWQMHHRWARTIVIVLLALIPVTAGLRAYGRWYAKDIMPQSLLENVEALRNATPKDARIIFGNDHSPHISLYHLRHFGWTMHEEKLELEKFPTWLEKGAQYFYSNSRTLEEIPTVKNHLDTIIGTWGEVRVWKLK